MKSSRTVSPAVAISQVSGHHGGAYSDQTSASGRAGTCACWHTIELFAKRSGNGRLPTTAAKARRKSTLYAAPGAVDAYRKTGHFPNAAVLMKEFFATSTNEAITGTVSHADKLKGWFVMVRETAGDRTRQPVWGGRRVGMVVVRRRQAAQGYVDGVPFRLHECHVAATATGRIYVNGYPVLRH